MRPAGLFATAALIVASAAGAPQDADIWKIAVYWNSGEDSTVTAPAQYVASQILAGTGVRLEWRPGETARRQPHAEGIVIDLRSQTPNDYRGSALAYAQAYEG